MEPMQIAGLIVGGVLAVCGAISTVGAAAEKVVKVIRAARAPNDEQNARLDRVEKHMKEIDGFLSIDKKRLDDQEKSNRITQRALLGLLEHGIDGNSIERMQASRKELENHLIDR